MQKLRITLQIIFFSLFLILFFFINKYPYAYTFKSEMFLQLNPLAAIATMIASRNLIFPFALFSLFILLGTIFLGRFFCGFFCPLGAMIDFFDRFFFGKIRLKYRPPRFLQRVKYAFLFIILILSIFGVLFPLFMDPISISTRFLTFLVYPIFNIVGIDLLNFVSLFSTSYSNLLYSRIPLHIPLYYGIVFTFLMMVFVFGTSLLDKRFWCQYICPTGAFLGFLSRFSFFRRQANKTYCNDCKRCVKSCPVRAIDENDLSKTRVSECIECGICVQLKTSCSKFSFSVPSNKTVTPPDLEKRHLLTGIAGGLFLLPVFRATAIGRKDDHGKLIRPPGAIPENVFLSRCITCGECMKVCPTNALQPCMFTDGFSRLYTPKLVPRVGGCEEKCSLCGNVCPTNAIRKLPLEEKRFAKIGTAVVDRHRCLAWEQNKECLVCDEVCPYNAIEARIIETVRGYFKVPVVNQDLCLGCGMCEHSCPIFDKAAIVVYKFGENRRSSGVYATERQKVAILEQRRVSDSKYLGKSFHSDGETKHDGMVPEKHEGFISLDEDNKSIPEGFME